MPALPSPGKVFRVHLRFGPSDLNQWGVRFYISYTGGPPNAGDTSDFADITFGLFGTNIMPLVESNLFLTECQVIDLSSPTGAEGLFTGSVAGGDSSGIVPEDVCVIINHDIGRRYRGGKPKTFLPPAGVGGLADDKSWSSGTVSAFTAAWEAAIAAMLAVTEGTFSPSNIVSVSYYHGFTVFTEPSGRARNIPTVRPAPLVDNITSSAARGLVGSQRRRRTAISG